MHTSLCWATGEALGFGQEAEAGAREKARQDRINHLELASSGNSIGLCGIKTALPCLVPGPGLIQGKGNTGLVYELDKEMGVGAQH